ncbi:hypothetical protein Q7A53_05175 [Halobacillus rhizosphaerae]|uniref:hypothetical protein n=1 Tax=Halobacillus rhizosphaerae TaxID=3064889 RepID=UPI00398B9486
MKFFGNKGQVSINNKTYIGNNISITNDTVFVDGVAVDDLDNKKTEITVICNVDSIMSEESIYIKGNVTGNVEAKNNVNCDDINGNVTAGNNVNCDDIDGDVKAERNINCDDISGNAQAQKIIR